ncbi:MAG: hypothetical protein HFJ80_05040 [Clostridiales bacterium]|nr:hypothetical protein [Clostridiales bacterium]
MKKAVKKSLGSSLTACLLAVCLLFSGCEVSDAPIAPGTEGESTTPTTSGGAATPDPVLSLVEERYTDGLGEILRTELYENGSRAERDELIRERDNKVFYLTADKKRVINYADGYLMDVPLDMAPDYSLSPIRSRYSNADTVLTVTKETIPEGYTYDALMDECYNYLLKDSDFIRRNRVSRQPSEEAAYQINRLTGTGPQTYTAEFFTMKLAGMPEGSKDLYQYVLLTNKSSRTYYFFLCKSSVEVDMKEIIESFQLIQPQGTAVYNVQYNLTESPSWSEETRAYYRQLKDQKHVDWGLFSGPTNRGDLSDVHTFDQLADVKLPIASIYRHVWEGFPMEAAKAVDAEGRMLQFTYQFTDNNNTDIKHSHSEALEVYRGKDDKYLYELAQALKEYGKPVLFRLNNEMNTDWTSYSACGTMLDPDIFVENWIRLYNIFEEVGVDNAIWIFNPNGVDCPQAKWGHYLTYMPPAQYVQMLGVTEYVSGHSGYPSFEKVYSDMEKKYSGFFGDWPWIISEFACGTGNLDGRKEQIRWVEDMLATMASGRFPQIKAAIWFSGNDYREDGSIQNEYQLDFGNSELMQAFREGLADVLPKG